MKNSLSSLAKNEILKQVFNQDCCELAFLSAVIHTAGSLLFGGQGKLSVIIKSVNPLLRKKLDKSLTKLYETATELKDGETRLCGENIISILTDCGILKQAEGEFINLGIDDYITDRSCCAAAYAGGAFVGCGSLSASKSGYHLEFALEGKIMADDLIGLLLGYGIAAKYIERKDRHIVYLKDNEMIGDCLAFFGAVKTALDISGMYVDRHVRQQSNRRINCDMANLDRTVSAGVRQAELFFGIINRLTDEKQIETARARIANPEASYEQLSLMLNISKSGIKHRLKKLEEAAIFIESDNKQQREK